MNIFTNSRTYLKFIILSIFLIAFYGLYSYSNGYTGLSEKNSGGCSCHGSSSSNTTLSLTSSDGSFIFDPNQKKSMTLTVKNTSKATAGFNLSAKTKTSAGSNIGTLTAGTGSKLSSNELTHSSDKAFDGNGDAAFPFEWTAPSTPGDYYILAIGNAVNNDGSTSGDNAYNWMNEVKVTVKGLTLKSLTGGQSHCAGSSVDITWDNFGITNVKIELSNNGGANWETLIASTTGTSWTWNIPGSQTGGTNYRIRISDVANSDIKSESSSNFTIGAGHSITTQPQTQTLCTGQSLQLSVVAEGTGLTYQWKKGGSDITSAKSANYTKANITTADEGAYTCEVKSSCGSPILSEIATISINPAPSITSFSPGALVCVGGEHTLTVVATGSGLTYKWFKNNVEIPNQTQSTLTLTNIALTDGGDYKVDVISDNCGKKTSEVAKLTVGATPVITLNTQSTTTCQSSEVKVWVNATGASLNYQWYKNSGEITGAVSNTLTLANFSVSDIGDYFCEVSNNCGSINSEMKNLPLISLPTISTQPANATVNVGNKIQLSVEANGQNLDYKWYKDNQLVVNQSGKDLIILTATSGDAGTYYCQVSNDCGTVKSQNATVIVNGSASGPLLVLNTQEFNFGTVSLNKTEKISDDLFFKNVGESNLTITKIELAKNNGIFALQEINQFTLEPNQTNGILISFTPTVEGIFNDTLIIESSDGKNNKKVFIFGEGKNNTVTIQASTIDFTYSDAVVNTTVTNKFNLENKDNAISAILTNISLIQKDPNFELGNGANIDVNASIAPLSNYEFEIIFQPKSEGTFDDIIRCEFENANTVNISIKGTSVINSVKSITSLFSAYPNPSTNEVKFSIVTDNSAFYNFAVYDILGNKIKEFDQIYINKNYELVWNLSSENISKGTYNLVISNNESAESLKFIIE